MNFDGAIQHIELRLEKQSNNFIYSLQNDKTFSCENTQITYYSLPDLISKIGSYSHLISSFFAFIASFFIYKLFAKDMAMIILENYKNSSESNNDENIK